MNPRSKQKFTFATILATSLASFCLTTACRQSDPDPYLNRDLGQSDRPLLPISTTAYSEDITKGSAQITRKDDFTPTPRAPKDPAADARTFLEEVNQLLAERNFEELPKFVIEEQQAGATATFETTAKLLEAFDRFAAVADEKEPGTGAAIKQQMSSAMLTAYDPSKLVMTGPESGEVPTAGGKAQVIFKEGYWYLKNDSFPSADQVDDAYAAMEETVKRIDAMTEDFKNDKINPLMLAPRLMEAMKPMTDFKKNQ